MLVVVMGVPVVIAMPVCVAMPVAIMPVPVAVVVGRVMAMRTAMTVP